MDRRRQREDETSRTTAQLWAAFGLELLPLLSLPLVLLSDPFRIAAVLFFFCAGFGWLLIGEGGIGLVLILYRCALATLGIIFAVSSVSICLFGCSRNENGALIGIGVVWLAAAYLTPPLSAVRVFVTGRRMTTDGL